MRGPPSRPGRRTYSASSSSAVLATWRCVGSGDEAAQEGEALDQLRDALQPEQQEADRQQREHRPAHQAAGVVRHLVHVVGPHDERHREVDDDDDEGQQECADADDVDPDLGALAEAAGDDVDLHVLLAQQRVAGGQQEDRGEEVPLDLEQAVRALVEDLAHDRVAGTDEHGREDQPSDPSADELVQPVDQARKGEQRGQGVSGRSRPVRSTSGPVKRRSNVSARWRRQRRASADRETPRSRENAALSARQRGVDELARARARAAEREDGLGQRGDQLREAGDLVVALDAGRDRQPRVVEAGGAGRGLDRRGRRLRRAAFEIGAVVDDAAVARSGRFGHRLRRELRRDGDVVGEALDGQRHGITSRGRP